MSDLILQPPKKLQAGFLPTVQVPLLNGLNLPIRAVQDFNNQAALTTIGIIFERKRFYPVLISTNSR